MFKYQCTTSRPQNEPAITVFLLFIINYVAGDDNYIYYYYRWTTAPASGYQENVNDVQVA